MAESGKEHKWKSDLKYLVLRHLSLPALRAVQSAQVAPGRCNHDNCFRIFSASLTQAGKTRLFSGVGDFKGGLVGGWRFPGRARFPPFWQVSVLFFSKDAERRICNKKRKPVKQQYTVR